MALEIPFSVKITNPLPVIATYMNGNIPFVSTIEANAATAGVRHIGMTVNINNVEYSYKNGILDQDLVIKDSDISRIKRFSIIATTNGVESFTLPEEYSQIIGVFINGWLNEDISKPNNTTVIVNSGKAIGQEIIILYLVDENLNIAPYYTQAQTDALIAGVGGGVTTHDIISTDIFIDPDEVYGTVEVDFIQGFWYKIGDYVFVEVSFEVLFFPSNAEDSGSFLLTFLNGLNVVTFIGKIVKGDSLYTLTETFYTAKVEGFSANKVKIKYNGSTSAETSHIVSVRFNFKTT